MNRGGVPTDVCACTNTDRASVTCKHTIDDARVVLTSRRAIPVALGS